MRISTIIALSLLSLVSVGCDKREATALTPKVVSAQMTKPTGDTNRSRTKDTGRSSAIVAKVVFVGKEHPCDCTRKRVDAAWTALQKTLGTPSKLPVERLQVDTEADKVEPYLRQKPIIALPAIYFVDSKSVVVELLQGDVTTEQITAVLSSVK